MCDLIRRQDAIDAHYEYCNKHPDAGFPVWSLKILENLPSAQPEPCEDAVSRNAIIQKLNTMDRYVSEELRLCDTDKKFPQNEVFIVDDVYEEIVEQLPSAQPKIIRCKDCKHHGTNGYRLNCAVFCCTMPDDGFCSCGERREDG